MHQEVGMAKSHVNYLIIGEITIPLATLAVQKEAMGELDLELGQYSIGIIRRGK